MGARLQTQGRSHQFTNCLAQLCLLSELNGVDAWLVFVYFMNDEDVDGPRTEAEWKAALLVMYGSLGLPKRHALSERVMNVFVDMRG